MKPLLTIAIPTYRNFRQLMDCLMSLTGHVNYPYRIIVVNNGPIGVDPTLEEAVRRHVQYPFLDFIHAEKNLGWQGGINRAFEEAEDTPYFCMLNDDVVFPANCASFFRRLITLFNIPECGAVGPCTNYVMGVQNVFNQALPTITEVKLLIGFCLVVRSKLFAEIGGLDEGLPGGDDLDLSILIRQAGYKLLHDRLCYLHHIGQQTGLRLNSAWNTPEYSEMVNNALIAKHGVRSWYETIQGTWNLYEPIMRLNDEEGDRIRAWVGNLKDGLDIGCGGNKTVTSAIGVDRVAKGEPGVAGGTIGTTSEADVTSEADELPFAAGTQDYIVARHIVEHILDPLNALWEWNRVLKPGGTLAIACPNHDACDTITLDWSHIHAYTPDSLMNLVQAAGFDVEEVTALDGLSFVLKARKPW